MKIACVRCGCTFAERWAEYCWWCSRPTLCADCHEKYGHCGHSEADAESEAARRRVAAKEGA
jgi:hypothetical protein